MIYILFKYDNLSFFSIHAKVHCFFLEEVDIMYISYFLVFVFIFLPLDEYAAFG